MTWISHSWVAVPGNLSPNQPDSCNMENGNNGLSVQGFNRDHQRKGISYSQIPP